MKYTWWGLFKSQYSWKNERDNVIVVFIVSVVFKILTYISEGLVYESSGDPVEFLGIVYLLYFLVKYIWLLMVYYALKFVLLGVIACGLVTYCCKSNDEALAMKAKRAYDEMFHWRK